MNLPFTAEQFLDVFAQYNAAIWPIQVVAYVLGLTAVVVAFMQPRYSGRIITSILAAFWLWTGIVYHGFFFSQINPAALAFGTLFVLQGLLWVYVGGLRDPLIFDARGGPVAVVGGLAVLYAMLIYPLLGIALGHSYPYAPLFGVAPCPMVIFTFGLLLWTRPPVPKYLLVIPLLWSLLGLSAALSLGIREDFGLSVAGPLGTMIVLWRDLQTGPRTNWHKRLA
jgi:drug/metabolite transporter superfamily protein YnfA